MSIPAAPAVARFDGGCAFVDGQYVPLAEAKISLFDWGFTRSDATYDVASVWQGAFFRLDAHIERFFASLQRLRTGDPARPRRTARDPARLRARRRAARCVCRHAVHARRAAARRP
jgi:branched-subunit amino acid aminotransferase/4-amino-4-deoxychorismate lyase